MANFRKPTYNLAALVWTGGSGPPGPARLLTPCALRSRIFGIVSARPAVLGLVRILLVPPKTDLRGLFQTAANDTVEVPQGSGRFYTVADVDDVARGYANEFRIATLLPVSPTPIPLP